MKKLLILSILVTCRLCSYCQIQVNDNDAIKGVISRIFDSMRDDDTTSFQDEFAGSVQIQYVESKNDTATSVITVNPVEYLKQMGTMKNDAWTETITRYDDININSGIATVWAPYKFYLGKKFDHCGITVFQLIKRRQKWKVVSIFYSVKTGNCPD
jgi:hypothetical protein